MIYQSTGAFRDSSILGIAEDPKFDFINGFEMSAGPFVANINSYLSSLSSRASLAIHNYFPVPRQPFVLNLSSQNPEIVELSLQHVRNAIRLAARHCDSFYSFHAGFLIDPQPNELGNLKANGPKLEKLRGLENFVSRVNNLSHLAREHGVTLMIENNVCSRSTLDRFGDNPLLFADIEGATELVQNLDSEIKILCDFAHLRVSAQTIGFNPDHFLEVIEERLTGCHLSDNDGFEDQNQPFDERSWFWGCLPKNLSYYSVEVYDGNADTLETCHELVKKHTGLQ